MINSTIRVVCDAGPIIHLDELNCLDLFADFQEILIPDTVWKEIKRHRPLALKNPNLAFTRLPGRIPDNEPLLTSLYAEFFRLMLEKSRRWPLW